MSQQIHRVTRILSRLSAGNVCTAEQLWEYVTKYNQDAKIVTKRQIERDIKAIIESGVPLKVNRRDRTVYYSIPKGSVFNVGATVNSSQPFLLYMIKAALPMLREESLQAAVEELMEEIEQHAPGQVVLSDTMLESIGLGHYSGEIDHRALSDVMNYIAQKRWIRVIYGEQSKSQLLFPFKIIPYLGRLYLAVWHGKHDSYGVYAVDKIKMVYQAPSPQPPIPKFDLKKFMSTRFGLWEDPQRRESDIEIHMTNPKIADFFRSSYWHVSQKIITNDDGTLTIKMKAGLSPELVSWVLHWAPDLLVVRPQELRDEVRRRAELLLR